MLSSLERLTRFALVSLCCVGVPWAAGAAETVKVSVISDSASAWPLRVAQDKGFFTDVGLDVQVTVTVDSAKQLQGLADGTFDITHQAFDHFVAGVGDGKPLVVFMTVSRPIFDFVVQPGIKSIADLKGKTIALDSPKTGYWLLFKRVFAQKGLLESDYKLLPDLGGAENRYKAVQEDRAQGTHLNPPLSFKAVDGGLVRLTGLADLYKDLPGTSAGVRRDWVKQHEAALVAYIRGYVKAVDFMADPKNREEALLLLSKRSKGTSDALGKTYDSFVRDGMVAKAAVSMPASKQVLDVLVESGQLTADKAKPEIYADPSYQEKAVAGR